MFADDTNLTYARNNMYDVNNKFNEDLANITECLSANKLTLKSSKTEFLFIGSRQIIKTFQSPPSLAINGVSVRQVAHTSHWVHILTGTCLGTFILKNCAKKFLRL